MKFTSVAFDLDGTLYPNHRFFIRLIPFLLREQRLLRIMGKARTRLRKSGSYDGDFYEVQARMMAEIMQRPYEEVKERTERLIYRGWEPLFKGVKLFSCAKETLTAFRNAGIKLGLLSDFPPETKLANLGISGFFDVVICSEVVGSLKPDMRPFLELARKMDAAPESILYVGNSVKYDIIGAHKTGMKTALVRCGWGPLAEGVSVDHGKHAADICFRNYRQLRDYVLS